MKTFKPWSLLLIASMMAASAQAGHMRSSHPPPCRDANTRFGARTPSAVNYPRTPSCAWTPTPRYGGAPAPARAPSGYWTWREQRVWVSGRWIPQTSPYTGCRSVWQGPHYETRWVQVWVSLRG